MASPVLASSSQASLYRPVLLRFPHSDNNPPPSTSTPTATSWQPRWAASPQQTTPILPITAPKRPLSPKTLPEYMSHGGFQELRDMYAEKQQLKEDKRPIGSAIDDNDSSLSLTQFPPLHESQPTNFTVHPRRASSSSTALSTNVHRRTSNSPAVTVTPPTVGHPLDLPTRFAPAVPSFPLVLSSDALEVRFNGKVQDIDQYAAAVRSNRPIPAPCGIFYFEVEILSRGKSGEIGIGFQKEEVELGKLPGWELNSWGYHGDDGQSFHERQHGEPYGPTFTTGDIVGCCLNFGINEVFFTKNGANIGKAFSDICNKGPLWPVVGLKTLGEHVRVNFGARPFKFDIAHYAGEAKSQAWNLINATLALPPIENDNRSKVLTSYPAPKLGGSRGHFVASTDPKTIAESESYLYSSIDQLILDYFIHHGFVESARALSRRMTMLGDVTNEMDITQDAPVVKEMLGRQRIHASIMKGDIDTAIELLKEQYPAVLATNPDLLFYLRCRKFVELVINTSTSTSTSMDVDSTKTIDHAMAFGQQLSAEYASDHRPEIEQSLKEASSILAYTDLSSSPVAYLLEQSQRQALALKVNSAILLSLHRSPTPRLESVYRQAVAAMRENTSELPGLSAFVSIQKDLRP